MALRGQQKRTFLPYERGIPPEDLRLGSLYINPLEPTDGLGSNRFEYREDLFEQDEYDKHINKWARKPEKDTPFSIQFERSQAGSVGLSFSDWLGIKGEREKSTLVTLQGESGRRLKVRNPERFLEEVMKQDGLDKWIRNHASIAHKSKNGRHKWRAPELWMVTGVQYVTGGEFHFEGNASNKMSANGGGDLGPAVGAPPGVLKAKAEASRERSNGAQNDFGHEDERVWAAQFMPVKIEFGLQEPDPALGTGKDLHPKTILQVQLEDVPDLTPQGFRASQEPIEQPNTAPPELVGRVTAEPANSATNHTDDSETEDHEGLVIDDKPYVTALREANWEMYDEYSDWLRKRNGSKQGRSKHTESST